jgi:chlorite dismutase
METGATKMTGSAGKSERPPGRKDADEEPREFLKYTFYKVRPEWRRLPADPRKKQKAEFASLLHELEDEVTLRCYSLQGIRADVDFMIWAIDPNLETFRDMARRISSTELGSYLDTTYAFLAASKRSQYIGGHIHPGQDGATKPAPIGSRYLFVYPFTKKREWYSIPFDRRQEIMRDHIRIGHRYPDVRIHTAYSFGLDDQEFVLSFEADQPLDFLDLVMELRSSEASRFTEKETPIFTCILSEPESMLEALGS